MQVCRLIFDPKIGYSKVNLRKERTIWEKLFSKEEREKYITELTEKTIKTMELQNHPSLREDLIKEIIWAIMFCNPGNFVPDQSTSPFGPKIGSVFVETDVKTSSDLPSLRSKRFFLGSPYVRPTFEFLKKEISSAEKNKRREIEEKNRSRVPVSYISYSVGSVICCPPIKTRTSWNELFSEEEMLGYRDELTKKAMEIIQKPGCIIQAMQAMREKTVAMGLLADNIGVVIKNMEETIECIQNFKKNEKDMKAAAEILEGMSLDMDSAIKCIEEAIGYMRKINQIMETSLENINKKFTFKDMEEDIKNMQKSVQCMALIVEDLGKIMKKFISFFEVNADKIKLSCKMDNDLFNMNVFMGNVEKYMRDIILMSTFPDEKIIGKMVDAIMLYDINHEGFNNRGVLPYFSEDKFPDVYVTNDSKEKFYFRYPFFMKNIFDFLEKSLSAIEEKRCREIREEEYNREEKGKEITERVVRKVATLFFANGDGTEEQERVIRMAVNAKYNSLFFTIPRLGNDRFEQELEEETRRSLFNNNV